MFRDAEVDRASVAADTQRYLVVARANARSAQVTGAVAAAGGVVVRELAPVGVFAVESSEPGFLSAVSRQRAVEAAQPMPFVALPEVVVGEARLLADAVTPDVVPEPPAAFFDELWGIARVHAPAAWERGVTGSHDTVVAVIDTGIASNHPDVAPNLVFNACIVSDGDHTTGACTPYPSLSFHGTHVAGTVAANFGGGVVGVGPNLGLANYNVFELIGGDVLATFDSVWAAMIDAADQGFDVINMSLGALSVMGPDTDNRSDAGYRTATKRVTDYVLRAGTVIVASAGNSAFDLTGPGLNLPGGAPGIINTGATGIRPDPEYPQEGSFDVLAYYSNFGAPVDLVAPGGDCGLEDSCDPATRPPNFLSYTILSSSVAPTPACAATERLPRRLGLRDRHLDGGAAPRRRCGSRARRRTRGSTPRQVHSVLQRTAGDIGHRLTFGHGIVDADAATR
jgi:lantibiotic leader peptide-processing serine protease